MIFCRMEETESPQPPKVSVLIVSHNSAAPLRRCLEALERSQQRESFEILVVDAGSLDESPTLDLEFPSVTILRLPRHFGLTKALNIGMRTAKGEFVLFLDPSVEALPDTVSGLAAALEAEPEAVAVCPVLVSPEGQPVPEIYMLPDRHGITAARRALVGGEPLAVDASSERLSVQMPSLAALMVRLYFLKGLRYIDERYSNSWIEAEICFQILRASRKILLLPGVRAVRHPEPARVFAEGASLEALLAADWALCASVYAGKRYGFLAAQKVRWAAVLGALGALFGFRRLGYHWHRLVYLLQGQKLDGSQRLL
jgi:GT2 family glycosyltransferase